MHVAITIFFGDDLHVREHVILPKSATAPLACPAVMPAFAPAEPPSSSPCSAVRERAVQWPAAAPSFPAEPSAPSFSAA